jgi:hypothetical protein
MSIMCEAANKRFPVPEANGYNADIVHDRHTGAMLVLKSRRLGLG